MFNASTKSTESLALKPTRYIDISAGSQLSSNADIGVAAYLLFIWILSLYANGVVLIGIARQKGHILPLDILMGFLAISNGLLALTTYPMVGVSLISHQWKFGHAGCVGYAFITMFLGLASIFDLPGIAYVLHSTVASKHTARKGQRSKKCHCGTVWIIIPAICTLSFLLCILPIVGMGEYGLGKHGSSCTIKWSSKSLISVLYITFLMITGFALPVFLTAVFYYRVISHLRSLKRRYVNMEFAKKWTKVQNDTLMMTLAVGVCMIVCWAPYAIVATWETFYDPSTLPVQLEATAAFTAKSSTAFTPLVHLCYTKKCRQWLRRTLFCFKRTEDSSPSHQEPPTLLIPRASALPSVSICRGSLPNSNVDRSYMELRVLT
ncbi:visual pigment-like receptor peropsin [Paramacrobiotus metropolitanus]|uniref:visual pigment-like receptor peropsin n=1 Tax=Paramacrobiotus metropolitanus TaxID=2943436 RepID=UPI002445D13F|nr:visual pigment-like receptor peropsin [Paramacrobiotus metropolitanus]XP_055337650.1 visual pigment-like receptor peropsin [Paramacrobiotus metropolitanus]